MLRVNINMTIEYMTKWVIAAFALLKIFKDDLKSKSCIWVLPLSSPEKGGGPKVGWTLDQKESIKSALFIGYVIMQVCFKKNPLVQKLRNIQLREVIMRKNVSFLWTSARRCERVTSSGIEIRDILCDGLPKVPGGRLGDMLGTKKVFGLAM